MSQVIVLSPDELAACIRQAVREEVGALVRESKRSPSAMDSRAAAAFLGMSEQTLRRWRCNGFGPKYSKQGGKIMYRTEDLDTWRAHHTVLTSE